MNEPANLNCLISTLTEAVALAEVIKAEYAANGMDSLANIDYGAALNATIKEVAAWFRKLADSGMFTMGQE